MKKCKHCGNKKLSFTILVKKEGYIQKEEKLYKENEEQLCIKYTCTCGMTYMEEDRCYTCFETIKYRKKRGSRNTIRVDYYTHYCSKECYENRDK